MQGLETSMYTTLLLDHIYLLCGDHVAILQFYKHLNIVITPICASSYTVNPNCSTQSPANFFSQPATRFWLLQGLFVSPAGVFLSSAGVFLSPAGDGRQHRVRGPRDRCSCGIYCISCKPGGQRQSVIRQTWRHTNTSNRRRIICFSHPSLLCYMIY